MVHSWENVDSLPRFVSLLRMAHGPVNRDEVHCDIQMALEELEELEDGDFFNPDVQARCILSCRACGQISWAWFD